MKYAFVSKVDKGLHTYGDMFDGSSGIPNILEQSDLILLDSDEELIMDAAWDKIHKSKSDDGSQHKAVKNLHKVLDWIMESRMNREQMKGTPDTVLVENLVLGDIVSFDAGITGHVTGTTSREIRHFPGFERGIVSGRLIPYQNIPGGAMIQVYDKDMTVWTVILRDDLEVCRMATIYKIGVVD